MSQTKAQLIDPVDGTIVNADINASAAIAGTKISPDFGSQAITTTNDSVTIGNSIIHSGDTDTKINFPAANTFTINTAGSERFRVDSSGKVGIGVTNPDRELDISNSSGNCTISLRSSDSHTTQLLFGDVSAELRGRVGYQSSDVLDFYTAASERMRIDSSGNVGIGVSSPATILHISQTNPELRIQGTNGNGGVHKIFSAGVNSESLQLTGASNLLFNADTQFFRSSDEGTEYMRIDSSGRLGIGTSSPTGFIHIEGSSNGTETYGRFSTGSANGDQNLYIQSSSSRDHMALQVKTGAGANDDLSLNPSGGNVGIGTTSPSRLLHQHVSSSAANYHSFTNDTTGSGSTDGLLIGINNDEDSFVWNYENTNLRFGTNNSERMRINANGYVSIGTTGNSYQLHVKGGIVDQTVRVDNTKTGNGDINYIGIGLNTVTTGSALFGHTGHTTAGSQAAWMGLGGDDVAGGTGVKVFRGGNVVMMGRLLMGVSAGTNNVSGSDASIQVSYSKTHRFGIHIRPSDNNTGGGQPILFQNQAGGSIGSINADASNVSYNTSSDYRLKENVVAISDGITRLKQLKPSRFNFKINPSKTVDGFLAHEVTAVPEAISGTKDEVDSDNNPVYQGIDQSKLVPLLTAALQEAIAKIETLETKVAALEAA